MRRQIVCALAAVVLSASGAIGADKAKDEPKDDLKKLQGEWPVVAIEEAGHIEPRNINNKLVFDGDKLTIFRRGLKNANYRIKLDPSASPKAIDVTLLDGPLQDKTLLAVYEVDDNELWLCLANLGKPRPDGPTTLPGDFTRTLYKCQRPKKPAEAIAKELKKLNGTWTVVAAESQGNRLPQRTLERMKYVLSDGKMTGFFDGKESDRTFTYELVDIKSDPKKIDLREIAKLGTVINRLSIYKLDGDELTICMDDETRGRPSAFETKHKSGTSLLILKRQKP